MAKQNKTSDQVWYALAATRIVLGFVFLWAFLDKLLGLGFATTSAKAWINGGSPTTGFLKGVEGPFADFFNTMAGQSYADWLFMAGLLGIGAGLVFGIAIRVTVVAGSVMLLMMWMASLPIKTNPFVDDHIVYIFVLAVIGAATSRQKWSLTNWWQLIPLVKKNRWLI